jgi:uncharacterized coiled-coil protein SlyX
MNLEIQTALIAGSAAFSLLLVALLGRRQSRKNRELIEYLGQRVEELEATLAESRRTMENGSKGVAEQARKIAWLEAKIRRPDLVDEDEIVGSNVAEIRPNITEKRHRVLKLAGRGHDASTIAKTLGLMSGEVELIMNLRKAAVAA